MMGDVLKPCPFCGGEDMMVGSTFRDDWMTCLDCNAAGPYCATEAEAITAWNTRADAGCIAELVEALEAADKHFGLFAGVTINGKHDPDDVRVIAMIRATLAKVKGEAA